MRVTIDEKNMFLLLSFNFKVFVVVYACYLGVIYYGRIANADQTLATELFDYGLSRRKWEAVMLSILQEKRYDALSSGALIRYS